MNIYKSSTLSQALKAKLIGPDIAVAQISTDSRTLQVGDAFVAIQGENFDGHNFLKQAIENGAAALIINQDYYAQYANFFLKTNITLLVVKDTLLAYGSIAALQRQQFKQVKITAITGSCGKTSVKEMLTTILNQTGKILSTKANYNNEIGLPQTLLELNVEHQAAVIEMGATKQGDIAYLMQIAQPQITLITKVAPCHLETFKSLDGIAKAKSEIYSDLLADGIGVVNLDEKFANYWLGLLKNKKVISFGLNHPDKYHKNNFTGYNQIFITADKIIKTNTSTNFDLLIYETIPDIKILEQVTINLTVPGMHQLQNALAAAACAYAQHVPLNLIASGLAKFKVMTGRGEFKTGYLGAIIIDDAYNANPVSVKAGLDVLAAQSGKKIFVIGDMLELGENSKALHYEIGEYAKYLKIDQLFCFGELTKETIRGFGSSSALNYQDKAKLIADLLKLIVPNTIILIKGSHSMRMDEIVTALVNNKEPTNVNMAI